MEEKTNFKPIFEIIENKDFEEAERVLKEIFHNVNKTQKAKDFASYLIGYINSLNENKKASKQKAIYYLLNNMQSENSIVNAFFIYASIEDDKNIVLNYINLGLQKHKNSPLLLKIKLQYLDSEDKIAQIKENRDKEIVDYGLIVEEMKICYELKDWNLLKKITRVALENYTEDEDNFLDFKLINSIAIIMCASNDEISVAVNNLEKIIELDLRNRYNYSTYILLTYAYFLLGNKKQGIKIFNKIPVNNSVRDLIDAPFWVINMYFTDIYNEIFKYLQGCFDDENSKIKLNAIYSLYLFSPSELSNVWNCNKVDLKNIESYFYKIEKRNVIGKVLFSMYNHFNLRQKAFKLLLDMLIDDRKIYDDIYEMEQFFDKSNNEDFNRYVNDIVKLLNSSNIDYFQELADLCSDLISYLYKNKQYTEIVLICDAIGMNNIKNSTFTFYAAYSYEEMNKSEKSKELYSYIVEIDPQSSSAINNLGVIYEHEQNFESALKLYEKANNICSNETHLNNISRITTLIDSKLKQERKLKDKTIRQIGNRLSLVYFEKLGYDENLKECINKITKLSLRDILARDLESAVISIATRQYKSAQILFGSIVESVLIYVLKTHGIKNYTFNKDGKSKKIKLQEMNFVDLLEVAYLERYLDRKNYHLGVYIKDSRNSVHPEREIKDKMVFDEDSTMTGWNILKNILFKLL